MRSRSASRAQDQDCIQVPTVASGILKWKKLGTTRTLFRVAYFQKWSNHRRKVWLGDVSRVVREECSRRCQPSQSGLYGTGQGWGNAKWSKVWGYIWWKSDPEYAGAQMGLKVPLPTRWRRWGQPRTTLWIFLSGPVGPLAWTQRPNYGHLQRSLHWAHLQ